MEKFEPRIVGFLCNWCSYAGADLAGTSRLEMAPNLVPIKVMCSSRVDPEMVTDAFLRGADGVLIAGCHPGDCHYDKGNYFARRRFAVLRKGSDCPGYPLRRVQSSSRWLPSSPRKYGNWVPILLERRLFSSGLRCPRNRRRSGRNEGGASSGIRRQESAPC